MDSSSVVLSEFKSIVPFLEEFDTPIYLSSKGKLQSDTLKMPNLFIKYGEDFIIDTKLTVNNFENINQTHFNADIKKIGVDFPKLFEIISYFTKKDININIPQKLNKLIYVGKLNGFLSDFHLNGTFISLVGKVQSNINIAHQNKWDNFTIKGDLHSKKIDLGQALNNTNFGNTAFDVELSIDRINDNIDGYVDGNILEFGFKNYNYQNLTLTGNFNKNSFDGHAYLSDENLKFKFDGLIDFSHNPNIYQFEVKVDDFCPNKLNLTQKYEDLKIKFNITSDLIGNNIDSIEGSLRIDSIILNKKGQENLLKSIELLAVNNPFIKEKFILLKSDLISGILSGNYTLSYLRNDFSNLLHEYLPIFFKERENEEHINNFIFDINIKNLDNLSQILEMPLNVVNNCKIVGSYDYSKNKFNITSTIPKIEFKKQLVKNFNVVLHNTNEDLRFSTYFEYGKKSPVQFDIQSVVESDSLQLNIQLKDHTSSMHIGDIQLSTNFSKDEEDQLITKISLLPSNFWFKEQKWDIKESNIICKKKSFTFENFRLQNLECFLNIDGIVSDKEDERVTISANKIDLNEIFSILNVKNFSLGGILNGNIYGETLLKNPHINASLDIDEFKLNDTPYGNLFLLSNWNDKEQQIDLDAYLIKDNDFPAVIKGYINPKKDEIDININAQDFSLAFIRQYLTSFSSDFNANITGDVKFVGSLRHPYILANAYARNGRIKIDYLGTTYTFEDSIHSDQRGLVFDNITIYDKQNHQGTLEGIIYHSFFKNLMFGLNIKSKNMMLIDTKFADNNLFYGTAYGSGSAQIYGNSENTNIAANIEVEDKSKMNISLDTKDIASENSYIKFRKDTLLSNDSTIEVSTNKLKADIQLSVKPNTDLTLILDQQWGDAMNIKGEGNIGISYETGKDLTLLGNYTIDEGSYNFTLQNITRKKFIIGQGSNIKFQGSPNQSILDINAEYSLSASLLDLLDRSELTSENGKNFRTNTLVNCILHLTGSLGNPEISFGIELPNADEEIKQRVQSLISNDEMVSTQIIYLLALNRFYTPDYVNIQSNTGDQVGSFATSALSAQLNNILSEVTDVVNIGFNYHSGNYTNAQTSNEESGIIYNNEFEMMLSTQLLNNRLLINGNLGYRDGAVNGSSFIGDVDLEYKLNKSGKLRAKAYNHTNDMVYKTAQYTQGVGIMYREDFDSFKSLFESYKAAIEARKKKRQSKKADQNKEYMNEN